MFIDREEESFVELFEKCDVKYSLFARKVQKVVLEYATAPLRNIPEGWNDTRAASTKRVSEISNRHKSLSLKQA
jgi:hypothetical protein